MLVALKVNDKRKYEQMTKEIALTFDDGPWGLTTPRVLDELIAQKIPATFMIWGEHAKQYPELVKRAAAAKLFSFGNHTFSHRSLLEIDEKEIRKELEKTDHIIRELTGDFPKFIRPPFGDIDFDTLKIVNRSVICWSLDTESWHHHDANQCLERATKAEDGDILLMHDYQEAEAEALPKVIDYLQKNDFVFKTIPDLLGHQLKEEPYIYYSRDKRDKIGFK